MTQIKVLVIDSGENLQVCLETPEITTCHALDPDQGLTILKQEEAEVVVLNLALPGVTLEDVSRLKQARPLTQVVVLSEKDDPEVAAQARRQGAHSVLSGPVEPGILRKAIKKASALGNLISTSIEAARLAEEGHHEEAMQLVLKEEEST